MQTDVLKIGTRGSPLALAQANEVAQAITATDKAVRIEIVPIRTSGDTILDRPLADVGGKGLFTKEIERALSAGEIDLAVHSAKDLETFLPDGLTLAGFLPREDVRDVFISHSARSLEALPEAAVVGTASVRRQALVRRMRPDLKVEVLRGNVQTRLRKLAEGDVAATLLALAGLKRLGHTEVATAIMDPEVFPPALGQGAIAIEVRRSDDHTQAAVSAILDCDTGICLSIERGFLAALDGSCRTPIAGRSLVADGRVSLVAYVLTPDGRLMEQAETSGLAGDAAELGFEAGRRLRERLAPDFFIDWPAGPASAI